MGTMWSNCQAGVNVEHQVSSPSQLPDLGFWGRTCHFKQAKPEEMGVTRWQLVRGQAASRPFPLQATPE